MVYYHSMVLAFSYEKNITWMGYRHKNSKCPLIERHCINNSFQILNNNQIRSAPGV